MTDIKEIKEHFKSHYWDQTCGLDCGTCAVKTIIDRLDKALELACADYPIVQDDRKKGKDFDVPDYWLQEAAKALEADKTSC
jgi:hypothetical protein